VSVIFIQF